MSAYHGGFEKAVVGIIHSVKECESKCRKWKIKLIGILSDSGELYTLKELTRINEPSRFNFYREEWCFFKTHKKNYALSVAFEYDPYQAITDLDKYPKPSNEGEFIFHIVKIRIR